MSKFTLHVVVGAAAFCAVLAMEAQRRKRLAYAQDRAEAEAENELRSQERPRVRVRAGGVPAQGWDAVHTEPAAVGFPAGG